MTEILRFGKYKGQTILEVFEEDATYLRWCLNNVDFFDLNEVDKQKVLERSKVLDQEREDFRYECYGVDIY